MGHPRTHNFGATQRCIWKKEKSNESTQEQAQDIGTHGKPAMDAGLRHDVVFPQDQAMQEL
jgi:hypothetical protein